jgi:predicted Rossmann fold nucleotide-binding protein DprA/Smf involved in DNA uptake
MPQRIALELRAPLAAGWLLILSGFPPTETRVTADLAARRNALVSALATDTLILHATLGGRLETSLRQKPLPLTAPWS